MAFNNGCISQPAHRIPENVAIGSHELVWAVSGMLPQITVSMYSLLAECGMAEIPCHCSDDFCSSFPWNEHILEVPSKSILVVQIEQNPPRLLFPNPLSFSLITVCNDVCTWLCVDLYLFSTRLWAPWGQGSVCPPSCAISWAWFHVWSRRVIVRVLCCEH